MLSNMNLPEFGLCVRCKQAIPEKLIIAFKARRITLLTDKVWQEKGWTEDTMQQFLETHIRTPYRR
jgi:hypothetical protein